MRLPLASVHDLDLYRLNGIVRTCLGIGADWGGAPSRKSARRSLIIKRLYSERFPGENTPGLVVGSFENPLKGDCSL